MGGTDVVEAGDNVGAALVVLKEASGAEPTSIRHHPVDKDGGNPIRVITDLDEISRSEEDHVITVVLLSNLLEVVGEEDVRVGQGVESLLSPLIGIESEDAFLSTIPQLPSRALVTRRVDPPSGAFIQRRELAAINELLRLGDARAIQNVEQRLPNSSPTQSTRNLVAIDDRGHSFLSVVCLPLPCDTILPCGDERCTSSGCRGDRRPEVPGVHASSARMPVHFAIS